MPWRYSLDKSKHYGTPTVLLSHSAHPLLLIPVTHACVDKVAVVVLVLSCCLNSATEGEQTQAGVLLFKSVRSYSNAF